MDEQDVRRLVRQAIARHLGAPPGGVAAPVHMPAAAAPVPPPADARSLSFARFHLVRPAAETECLIEPTVTCTHCGHCQCYGH